MAIVPYICYGAAEDTAHQLLDQPTQNLMQRLHNLCHNTVVNNKTFEQYKAYVQDLKEHECAISSGTITFPATIITTYREQPYFIRAEQREEQLTPLMFALHKGVIFLGYMLAMASPHYITIADSRGNMPLHYLCRSLERNPREKPLNKISRALIHLCNAQINRPNNLGITPVMLLTKPQLIAAFALHGANIHHTNKDGQTAVTYDPNPFPERIAQKITTLMQLGANPALIRSEDKDLCYHMSDKQVISIQNIINRECKRLLALSASPATYFIIALRNREEFRKYATIKG
jgi:hypothetical protein